MRNELVSVVIPSYNRAEKVGIAIESVLRQDHRAIQLIVVDDGSTDGTEKVVSRYPLVQYIKKEHAGQAAARNLGLQFCKGDFVATLDSDDAWNSSFVSFCLQKIQKDKVDFVFTNWDQQQRAGDDKDFLSADPYLRPYRHDPVAGWYHLDNAQLRSLYLRACPSPSSSALIKRASIYEGWNARIKIGDDWCFYLDMIVFNRCKAAFTMERLWRKKINDSNIYDGRPWHEVLRFLYIHDVGCFMKRYGAVLSAPELALLRKKYIRALVELAKHSMIREHDFGESFRLMRQSMSDSPLVTLGAIPKVIANGFRNHTRSSEKGKL